MKKQKILFFSALIYGCLAALLQAEGNAAFLGKEDSSALVVNNRILAKVNGTAISVLDVMKKMDVLFYREFPDYTSSTQARYQFYKVNWKHVLDELVNKELVLADASENKLLVSNGDIRQEMESLFGPHIINNLDKIGLSYEEAQKIVQGDITIRRMIYLRVNAKALKKVTPQAVRLAYEEFANDPANLKPNTWQYNVISIRDPDAARSAEAAHLTYQALNEHIALEKLSTYVKANSHFDNTQINVSEEYTLPEKDISEAYKAILTKMTPHSHSQPIAQKNRADKNSSFFRIFVLKNWIKGGTPTFKEVELKIKDRLIEEAIAQETEAYLKNIRKRFSVQDFYTPKTDQAAFEPFILSSKI
ncbi:hypothetical protein [Neochlamydia sp. EPS4]|uniref:hypothetical protein n=1 Tax=Neochlamydia sp. EPS4 TaxID=1478175 RepID=UPI000694F8B3|nr:hypothetical protein [Neochlamydia sp. EPS4]